MANLVPKVNNVGSLGTASKVWNKIHVSTTSFANSSITEDSGSIKLKSLPVLVEGALTVAGSLSISAQASSLSLNSQKIINLGTPTLSADAATKGYVDSVLQGLDVKDSVRAATTENETLGTAFANGQDIDGVTLATNDRILIKNQSTASENGIYVVQANGAPSRAADLAASSSAAGIFVFVEEGTINADSGFVCTSNASADTVGTHGLAFSQFSGAGQITAGNGLGKSGNTLSVNIDDSSIEINSDALRVKSGGITSSMLASGAVTNSSLASSAITSQTALDNTTIADDDVLLVSDTSASGALKKITKAHFVSGLSSNSTLVSLTDTSISGPSAGQILVHDGSDSFDNVSISGDAALSSAGVLTIQAGAVEGSMLNTNAISGQSSEMAGDVADTDEFLISDAGVLKKADFSLIRDAVYADVTGDALIAAGGSLTIQDGSVEGSMLHTNAISQRGELTTGLVSTDELLVSDAGALKKMDVSVLQSYLQSNLTFATALTQENVEDFVGGMVSGNTETFITVSYDDSDGTLDFVVPVLDEDGMNSNSAVHLATQQSIKQYVDSQVSGGGLDISGYSNSLTDLAQDDLLVASDTSGGNEKKITFSDFEDAIFGNITGDALIAAGGALTIQPTSVENSMLAGSIANAKLANSSVTIGSTSTALGATSSAIAGLTQLDVDNIRVNGNTISSTDSNGNMILSPNGTGKVIVDGDGSTSNGGVSIENGLIDLKNGGTVSKIKFYCESNNLHAQTLQGAPHSASASNTLVLPAAAGTLVGTGDSGTVTNTMLAGSITASKLNNAIFADLETLGAPGSDGQFIVATGAGAFAYESANTARTSLGLGTGSSPSFTSLTLSGQASALAMNSQKITGLATPTADGDAATKSYVDSVAAGLDIYDSVKAASTASFTMASTASTGTLVLADGEGGFNATADTYTVDDISLSQNDRVLIKDGVNSNSAGVHNKWNGIYTVGALSGTTLTLTRATDMDASSEFNSGAFFFVEQGTNNADAGFVLTNDSSVTLGTTAIVFTQFSGAGQVSAGSGLTKSGNTLSVTAQGITNAMLADDAVGADELAANAVVNASIAANAAIDMDKLDGGSLASSLTDLAQGDLLYAGDVDDSNNLKSITFSNLEDAIFGNVSGDAAITAGGALSISAGAVHHTMLSDDIISGQAELAHADIVDADELMISDNGTIKKVGVDSLRDHFFAAISGDAAITDGGALTIANDSVEASMLHPNLISGHNALDNTTIADDDLILISDTSASGALKKITKAHFVSGLGSGSFASSDITGQTAITTIADDDLIVLADASDSNNLKKVTRTNFLSSLAPSFTAANGIKIGDFLLDAGQVSSTKQYLRLSMHQNMDSNAEPALLIENTSSDNSGGKLIFSNNHSGVDDGKYLGFIAFEERESSTSQINWGYIRSSVIDHSNFYGKLDLMVANGGNKVNGSQIGATLKGTANGIDFDIEDHNGGTAGLRLGGSLVTTTAAELNKLDGATVTTTEINLLDGGTSVGSSITVADGDGFIINDVSTGTTKLIPATDLKTYCSGTVNAHNIGLGTSAVTLATNSGNITIDAQANDSDIVFAGTDNSSHITMLTLDGSDAGTAIFNHDIKMQNDGAVLSLGTNGDVSLTHVHDAGLTLNSTRYLSFNDAGTKIWSSENGQLDLASDGTMVDSVLVNAASGGIKLNAGLDGNAAAIHLDSASGVTIAGGDNNDSVYVENSPIELEQISAPSTTTNKLYNVGGTLTWNGSAVGGGGSATIPKVLTGGSAANFNLVFESAGSNGDNNKVYLINNGSSARTVTLPTYSGNGGKIFQVKRIGTANVTIAVQTGESIEGSTNGTFVLSTQYESVTLIANDSGTLNGWYIV